MFIQSEKRKRLALDVIGQLEDDLDVNPLDYEKWNKLIQLVLSKDKEEQVKTVFNKYLSIFKFDVCIYFLFFFLYKDMEYIQKMDGFYSLDKSALFLRFGMLRAQRM